VNLEVFLDELRAPKGAPGGGAASALAGAIGCALFQMVSGITLSLPRFAENKDKLENIHAESEKLFQRFLKLTEEDTEAYKQVELALKMPKNTPEEKDARRREMQNAFRLATEVPVQVIETAVKSMALLPDILTYGNPNAITDVCVGFYMLDTAIRGASANAKINLISIKDEEFKVACNKRLEDAQNAASQYADTLSHAMKKAGLE